MPTSDKKETLDNSIIKYMLFQKFKYFGINLVDPTTFEVINVVFLRKSVVNELPRKITMFFTSGA